MSMENTLTEDLFNDSAENETDENTEKYLTFTSAGLTYGVTIEHVMEIITNPSITALPMVPGYVKGIINLRGQIVPIIDIRQIMGKPENPDNSLCCVIILELGAISFGILVDTVLQVLDIPADMAEPPSKNLSFVNGMTNLSDGSVMFSLDCDLLVNTK